MPLRPEEVRIDLVRATNGCWCEILVRLDALRPLGLHPDQPSARPAEPPWPRWSLR